MTINPVDVESVEHLIGRWDANMTVPYCEMGGLGPGYEQAIAILWIELLRELVRLRLPRCVHPSNQDRLHEVDPVVDKVHEQLGFSGSQVGAAKSLAFFTYCNGPKYMIRTAKNLDRLVLVSKHWPRYDPNDSAEPTHG